MATNVRCVEINNNQEKDVISTCPLCTENYRDPSILHCGHHFCLPCLEKIASGHPDGHVICPTCRHLTDVTDVSKLNKYNISELQAKANDFMANQPPPIEMPCYRCQIRTPAIVSCLDCSILFCEKCAESHKSSVILFGHREVPLTSNLFCPTHPELFIQCICDQCSVGCCHLCLNDHTDHNPRDIRTAAKDAREAFSEEIARLAIEKDDAVFQRIFKLAKEGKDKQTNFKKTIGTVKEHLQTLLKNVEEIESKIEELMKAELKKIDIVEFDVETFMKSKRDLQDYITQLSTDVSDADVVFKRKELPVYASSELIDSVDMFGANEEIKYLDLSVLNSFKNKLLNCFIDITDIGLKSYFLQSLYCPSPNNLELSSKLRIRDNDQAYYWKEGDAFVVYDVNALADLDRKSGITIDSIDIGEDITISDLTSITFDTKRKCFIIPTEQGSVAIINPDTGNRDMINPIELKGSILLCAAYCESKDLYIVCGSSALYSQDDFVSVIDPVEKENILFFKPQSDSSETLFIGCGRDPSLGKDELFLSCHYKNGIEVYDFDGNFLHAYGSEAEPMFSSPLGLYLGKRFNLACDYNGLEIVRFWRDKDGNRKETVVSEGMIDGSPPSSVHWDEDRRELYVCCSKKRIYVFKEKSEILI